jgi:predicted RNase H-like nuclease (RuvC/YqgF family)
MIDIPKKGLKFLKKRVASRKTRLETDLKAGKIISAEDEEWLDGAENLIDEERVVEILDNESDYEKGLEKLDTKDKGIVQELISLGGGEKKAPSKKRKRTSLL